MNLKTTSYLVHLRKVLPKYFIQLYVLGDIWVKSVKIQATSNKQQAWNKASLFIGPASGNLSDFLVLKKIDYDMLTKSIFIKIKEFSKDHKNIFSI